MRSIFLIPLLALGMVQPALGAPDLRVSSLKITYKDDVKTVLWIVFAIAVPGAACHAEEAAGGGQTQQPRASCDFGELKEWVGKREAAILRCFQTGGIAR